MRKLTSFLISCLLLAGLVMPMTALASEVTEEQFWNEDYSRVMDITESLTKAEMSSLNKDCMEFMKEFHMDMALASIPEARMEGYTAEEFAEGLYDSCSFGYGEGRDGFMCLYLEDKDELIIVPMNGAVDSLPQAFIDFVEERIPTYREKYGMHGVLYMTQGMIKSGLETEAEKAGAAASETKADEQNAESTAPEAGADDELEAEIRTEAAEAPGSGNFERCGEGSDLPAWFPANLDEAYVYFDAEAPRVVDYAGIISDEAEAAMAERIAGITEETGKDIVIVTDVSSYGLGEDIYAADFYDYNGYGIGEEHEGILLFINMDPDDRSGWTVETGSQTRSLATEKTANRLDDFLYETLAAGDYDRAFANWIEDVYGLFTKGIVRAPFWYHEDGDVPENYYDPQAPVVVDEWNLLSEDEIATLQEKAAYLKDTFGVNAYFHTTSDRLGMERQKYNDLYMRSMGYEKDAVLFTVENTGGGEEKYSHVYLYGNMNERIPEKYISRIRNNASTASTPYKRLFEEQRLLNAYLAHGRVPRNGVYWGLMTIMSVLIGLFPSNIMLSKAKDSMKTVEKKRSAYSYLDASMTSVRKLSEKFLYMTTSRVYISPRSTDSSSTRSSSGSSGRSTYKSSYTGHSGTSHTGHGRKF